MGIWIFKKHCMVLLAVVVALIAGMPSWGTIGADRAEASDTIRIGFPIPLTGSASRWGTFCLHGAMLAVKEINDGGGVLGKKLELIKMDDQNIPAEGVSAVQRLLNIEKVDLIMGAMGSSVTKALQPIVEAAAVPMVAAASSDPEITYRAGVGGFKYTFRNYPTDEIRALVVLQDAANKGYKKLALLAVDTDSGRNFAGFNKKYISRFPKAEFVSTDFFGQNETDFRPILTRIKATGVEAIIFMATSGDTIQIVGRQMRELQLAGKVPFMGLGDLTHSKNLETLSDVLEGAVEANVWTEIWDNPRSKKFVQAYTQMWNEERPNFLAYSYWETTHLIAQAIKEAGSVDRQAVHKALKAIKYESIMGPVQFDDHHQANLPMVLTEVSKGKVIVTGTMYSQPDYPKQ